MRPTGSQEAARCDDSSDVELISPSPATCDVRDLRDGGAVDQVLLVRERDIRRTRAGADYMRLALADRKGTVFAVVRDDVDEAAAATAVGEPVRVIGSFAKHPRYGRHITVHSLLDPGEIDWERLLDAPAIPIAELERRLDEHIADVRDPHLAALMESLLGTQSSSGRGFRRAFAAQYNHHAYRCGLLEHSLQVADATADAARTFAGIDRDLAVCGALLHDIGKLETYSGDQHSVTMNDAGKLIGEIPGGYYMIRRRIEDIPGFPPSLEQALLHIILSHHGCLEHGSPVLPVTREALLVHTMDKLSGDLGSFERLERETAVAVPWSRYDRALGRSVLLSRSRLGQDAGRAVCAGSRTRSGPGVPRVLQDRPLLGLRLRG
jgi:3'-5' exoribonuclease